MCVHNSGVLTTRRTARSQEQIGGGAHGNAPRQAGVLDVHDVEPGGGSKQSCVESACRSIRHSRHRAVLLEKGRRGGAKGAVWALSAFSEMQERCADDAAHGWGETKCRSAGAEPKVEG